MRSASAPLPGKYQIVRGTLFASRALHALLADRFREQAVKHHLEWMTTVEHHLKSEQAVQHC